MKNGAMLMQKFQNKNSKGPLFNIVMVAIFLGCGFCLFDYRDSYAAEGGGGNTGGVIAGCEYNAYQRLCNGGAAGGGASWRIFLASDGYGLDDWTGYGGSILQASYKSQAKNACAGTGWFASFGWDGMVRSHYGYANYNFQIGPANRNGIIGNATYNSYNAKSYDWLVNNGFSNNLKITESAALELYRKSVNSGATGIPTSTGYFCIDPSKTVNKTLSGISVDTSGNGIGSNPNSKTVGNGKSATITAKDISNYEFLGWSTSKTGTPSGSKNYTVASLTQNTTVYAIYKLKSFSVTPKDSTIEDSSSSSSETISNGGTIWTRPGLEKALTFNYSITYSCINNLKWTTALVTPENHAMLQGDRVLSNQLASDNCRGASASPSQTVTIKANPSNVGTSTKFSKQINVTTEDSNISTKSKTATSSVVVNVPYNYKNSIEVQLNDGEKIVYSGTDAKIQSTITVGKKSNALVGGQDYATIVRNAQAKYIVRQGKNIAEIPIAINNGELNSGGSLEGSKDAIEQSIPVQDLSAGTQICVQAAVYPATSGADSNLNANGDGEWAFSEEKCATIAKRTSFQVWGSNGLYSSGKINSAFTHKTNAGNDYNGYYGSWTEHAIVANGSISGVASSAAIAKNGTESSNPICDFSRLTFANSECAGEKLGNVNVKYLNSFGDSLANNSNYSAIIHDGDYELEESENDEIHVAKGYNIFISGNQSYKAQSYSSIESIPQRIIYAKNIYIDCAVKRIDAILIAEETINTCSDKNGATPDRNNKELSNQLIVNGAVIAKKLLLNRTYGAATGEYSGVPAEIFNYSPSIYFWANNLSENKNGGDNYVQSYQREIAPRY